MNVFNELGIEKIFLEIKFIFFIKKKERESIWARERKVLGFKCIVN